MERIEFDERRTIVAPGNFKEVTKYAAAYFVNLCNDSIKKRGKFTVALSGGSTPKEIYLAICNISDQIDWTKVFIFFSDERAVFPHHPDSNYRMAMEAFSKLPIPANNIFRMVAETNIEKNASQYEQLILKTTTDGIFDLVMLGIGTDGHTASLFPHSDALKLENRLVTANFIPQKNFWRMTLTATCINKARNIAIFARGKEKINIVQKVLFSPFNYSEFPIQMIGTDSNKALWVIDNEIFASLSV